MSSAHAGEPIAWRVAARCNNGSCVAVAAFPGELVVMRDTKAPDGPLLAFSRSEWAAFILRIKAS
ncbi:DUF397 domain-containing protein [Nonomuraea sp. NPDC050556]|uniref:DUF397 domain-containing protein n=1 Tax=Nonomuraea sp. NPDC050556 TaxID=3364369 RepID=UPI003788F7AF